MTRVGTDWETATALKIASRRMKSSVVERGYGLLYVVRWSMRTQNSADAKAVESTPDPSGARSVFARPDFDKLTRHPVISPLSRELGWQVFARRNAPQLTPTIERNLAGVKILEHHLGPCAGRRSVGANSDEFFVVVHVIAGSEWGYGPRGAHRLRAGDIATWHSSQEVGFEVDSSVRKISYVFPQGELRGPLCPSPKVCDNSVLQGSALGAMVSGLFEGLSKQLDAMPARYHASAMAVAREFVSRVILVETASAENVLNGALVDRVIQYIDMHWDEPKLSPKQLAGVHGISLRYLHLLFARRGHTVSGWIRERRLEYCRQILANAHPSLSVSEVAFRAGFKDTSHFSRAFRQRFGVSPSEHRRASQHPPAESHPSPSP